MFVRCFCELNVCLDEYELFARPRVAGHYKSVSSISDKTSPKQIKIANSRTGTLMVT